KSDEGQIYTWASGTYDGKNRHRIHLSNFLNTDSHYEQKKSDLDIQKDLLLEKFRADIPY
ncbi:MAG: hypothetical protein LBV72_10695, partial [Tannerella sp.]|nr:hypothetical protein [Tannerella sp.]